MRALLAIATFLLFATPAMGATGRGDWDRRDQRAVVEAGLMAPLDDGQFHGERAIAGSQLQGALHALADRLAVARVAVPTGAVSVAGFDRLLVAQLGLADVADAVQSQARHAGLTPPPRFGTEVVARLLGLRYNHPASDERDELYPWDAITRAEAAWSFAKALHFNGSQQPYDRQVFMQYQLPAMTAGQRKPLRLAVSKIGMPYVWGGETDTTRGADGPQVHGGYDCSGYVWRVFKLSGNPAGRSISGRTAADQAGEIPKSRRIPFDGIKPADLLFFGRGSFSSGPGGIVHEGIALSGAFMIHASGQGVYVSPLFEQWRRNEFTWGRRVVF